MLIPSVEVWVAQRPLLTSLAPSTLAVLFAGSQFPITLSVTETLTEFPAESPAPARLVQLIVPLTTLAGLTVVLTYCKQEALKRSCKGSVFIVDAPVLVI